MKAVAPEGTTMMDVYRASVPIMCLNTIVMFVMIFFPSVVLFLPSLAAVK
jgi:TRAP-type mannitol/chloroaromatic compound transport system permease large subunit